MEKVYCTNCRYSFSHIRGSDYIYMRPNDCGFEPDLIDTPMCQLRKYRSIDDKNANNDCSDYERILIDSE